MLEIAYKSSPFQGRQAYPSEHGSYIHALPFFIILPTADLGDI